MKINYYIAGAFVAGLVLGGAVAALGVSYLYNQALYGENPTGLSATLKENLAIQKENMEEQEHATSVYGKVVAAGNGSITIEGKLSSGTKNFTFVADAQTRFVALSHDDVPVEVAFEPSTIAVGELVTVYTEEPIGSVSSQHALKVVRN